MAGPARAGVLIYAKHLGNLSGFYERLLPARVVHADEEHRVLQSADAQLILHAIPEQHSRHIVIGDPPTARDEQAIKPFFTVASLEIAESIAAKATSRCS